MFHICEHDPTVSGFWLTRAGENHHLHSSCDCCAFFRIFDESALEAERLRGELTTRNNHWQEWRTEICKWPSLLHATWYPEQAPILRVNPNTSLRLCQMNFDVHIFNQWISTAPIAEMYTSCRHHERCEIRAEIKSLASRVRLSIVDIRDGTNIKLLESKAKMSSKFEQKVTGLCDMGMGP